MGTVDNQTEEGGICTRDVHGSSLYHTGALYEFCLLDGEIDRFVNADGFPIVLGGFYGVEETVCKDCV